MRNRDTKREIHIYTDRAIYIYRERAINRNVIIEHGRNIYIEKNNKHIHIHIGRSHTSEITHTQHRET